MFETRQTIYTLLDHKAYYGIDKTFEDACQLLKDIPSLTLLNYVSGLNVNLYLSEYSEHSGIIQAYLVDSLIGKIGETGISKWKYVIGKQIAEGHAPILLWNYSNLLFYTLIFKNFNELPSRELSSSEAQKVFDAYLIINSIANERIAIEENEIIKAVVDKKVEEVIMPNFIYQKDYASSTDHSNQVTRGAKFFQYLENHKIFGAHVRSYYKSKNVTGYLRMFKNLMVLFSELHVRGDLEQKNQLANLQEYFIGGEVDLAFINSLCINSEIAHYNQDHSFGLLRNKLLYKINSFQYFILDVNFLIDQFYKAQVFAFNSYLKSNEVTNDFLSIKAKEFMEGLYLPEIIDSCFPHYIRHYGDACKNSNGDELCDVYLRDGSKICLFEFKDVLLSAASKNNADKEQLFGEFEKKFVANQKGKAKGISQLINAMLDIEQHFVAFDSSVPRSGLEIYPILLYTDYSFGIEGLNKVFKEKFRAKLASLNFTNILVHDITFVNLNFFEIRVDYLQKGLLNFLTMLDEFHKHTQNENYEHANFEVFSKFYMNECVSENLPLPSSYTKVLTEIIATK